jgi:hypothetical protein
MEWNHDKHVIDRIPIKLELCTKIISFDWGFNAPGCAIWLAITPEDSLGIRRVYAYRELYQNRKTPEEWARELAIYTQIEDTEFMVLPHDCFAQEKGNPNTIAKIFGKYLKTRIVRGKTLDRQSRLNRVAVMHQFLSEAPDGLPYLLFKDNCYNSIRTIPELVYDENNVEDVDTDSDDHPYDAISLGLKTIKEHYKLSGPVQSKQLRIPTEPIFEQDDKGNIKSPDFWEELKHPKKQSPEKYIGDE